MAQESFPTPQYQDLLWGLPSLLSNGYQVFFALGVKFTYVHMKKTRLHCGFLWLKIEIASQL
jgi:hypothetical protein